MNSKVRHYSYFLPLDHQSYYSAALLEPDRLIASLTHELQYVALAADPAIVKLTVGVPEAVSLRTTRIGVLSGIEIQCVMSIHFIVYAAGKRGTHHEILEFL
jgi:hypothetical protein